VYNKYIARELIIYNHIPSPASPRVGIIIVGNMHNVYAIHPKPVIVVKKNQ